MALMSDSEDARGMANLQRHLEATQKSVDTLQNLVGASVDFAGPSSDDESVSSEEDRPNRFTYPPTHFV